MIVEVSALPNGRSQSPDKWSDAGIDLMCQVFENHNELSEAYDLTQKFKKWYDISNHIKTKSLIIQELHQWYLKVKKVDLTNLP